MKAWHALLFTALGLLIAGVALWLWEERAARPSPMALASQTDSVAMTDFYAGGSPPKALEAPGGLTHEEASGYDVSEGKRLYSWYNCNTCHANGGGDIGPPLMDDKWIYGSEPRNIHNTILEGRPNGMPSFRGKIPEEQVWQIVAYVRSMSGRVPLYARPSRNDDLSAKPPETMERRHRAVPGGNTPADPRTGVQ